MILEKKKWNVWVPQLKGYWLRMFFSVSKGIFSMSAGHIWCQFHSWCPSWTSPKWFLKCFMWSCICLYACIQGDVYIKKKKQWRNYGAQLFELSCFCSLISSTFRYFDVEEFALRYARKLPNYKTQFSC